MALAFDQSPAIPYLPLRMHRRTLLLAPFAWPALIWPSTTHAHSLKHGDLALGHAWALPVGLSIDGQAFVPLLNKGKTADSLLGARSSLCSTIELRRNARYDDPPEKQFELLPLKPVAMRPSALHLRLIGLRQPLRLGDRFPVILDFLNGGEVEVIFYVENTPGT